MAQAARKLRPLAGRKMTDAQLARLVRFPAVRRAISSALARAVPVSMGTPGQGQYVHFRLRDPREFVAGLFATISVGSKGTKLVIGTPKSQVCKPAALRAFFAKVGPSALRGPHRRGYLYQLRKAGIIGGSRTQSVLVPRGRVEAVAARYLGTTKTRLAAVRNPDGEEPMVVSGPEGVAAYRMLALKGALNLETKGLRRSRGPSALSIIKREFGLKGSAQKVLADFTKMCEDVVEHRTKPPGFNPRSRRGARRNAGGIAVGDKVKYKRAWLRSVGAMTGPHGPARGIVTALEPLGQSFLAVIRWDRPGIAPKVLVDNLVAAAKRESENPLWRSRRGARRNPILATLGINSNPRVRKTRGKVVLTPRRGKALAVEAVGFPNRYGIAGGVGYSRSRRVVVRDVRKNPTAGMVQISVPFRDGQKVTPDRMRAWLGTLGSSPVANAIRARFEQNMRQYRRFHLGSEPTHFLYRAIPMGTSRSVTDVDFVTSEGKEWAAPYQVPRHSGKYEKDVAGRYLHSHGESGIEVEIKKPAATSKLPERFHTADGKFVGVLPSRNVKITDWYRG